MPNPRVLPSELGSAFRFSEALAAGASARRLRNADLAAPFRGARSRAVPTDLGSLARAYAPLLSPGQHFSHLTASLLHGLRMPEGFVTPEIHVTSLAPLRAPRRANVVGHQTRKALEAALVDGLPVSPPIHAWCESAGYLSVDDLIVMGDTLLRRRAAFATPEQLATAVIQRRGERGFARLSRALPQLRAGADSARETMLRLILDRAGFPQPEVNGEIVNRFGAVIAHGDLVYRQYRVIVEYDGDHHRTDQRQFNVDIDRLDQLAEENWRTIRVTKKLMWQRAIMLGKVAAALEAAGWRPRPR